MHTIIKRASISLAFLLIHVLGFAQCPDFYDTFGNPSSNPYWISCTGNDFTLELLTDDAYGPYTVDWGDGNTSSGAGYTPGGANPSHIYSVVVDTLVVTITIPGTGCVLTGVVVMEELVSAAIQIPNGGITKACAPQLMEFLNASTNVSATTWFTWQFGDGSPNETYDVSNWGATIGHTYQKGTVDCGTRVTLYAENYCSFGRPSVNTYEPILIWDIDKAAIDASATLLCYPDTVVTFNNVTDRNCVAPAEGNFAQRYERWRFIDYFGPGLDSIVDWRPWPPSQSITIRYPGKGTYNVELLDSNQCGIDPAYITINIVDPPTADFTISEDTVCTGQEFIVTNLSSGGANEFFWRIVGVTGWVPGDMNPYNYTFNTEGTYEFQLVANIAEGTVSCTDTLSKTIVVLPGPESSFTVTPREACDTLVADIVNTTVNGINWLWDFGNGTTSNQRHPVNPIRYEGRGAYSISLTVSSANNCSSVLYDTVHVYKTPEVNFTAANACIGTAVNFLDSTIIAPDDTITSWSWNFGDGNGSGVQNPSHQYTNNASYSVRLGVTTAHCASSITKPITLHPLPTAIMYVPDTAGCNPFQVDFQNFSTVSTTYEWDFGDGSPIDNSVAPSHVFRNNGAGNVIYTVRLVAITDMGCSDTTYQQILVYPASAGSFTHNGTPDCGPMLVQFINTSTGGTNYQWDFGDGSPLSSAPNPAHLYQNQTAFIEIYDASLIVTSPNGCTDAVTQSITVYPEPDFNFTVSPNDGCTPLDVNFSVSTNGTYQWDFGNGNTSTAQNPSTTYSHNNLFATTFTVQLIGTSSFGCVDTVTKTVNVKPNPVANFSLDTKSSCTPLVVNITNTSNMANSFQWQYGDGNGSTNSSGTHPYTYFNSTTSDIARVIKLTAIAANGCTAEVSDTVVIYGNPVADFDEPNAKCTPADIGFINRSQNAATYRWDFADGSPYENSIAPTHTFNNSGTNTQVFNVNLIAYSVQGCPDTTSKPVTVYPLPSTDFNTTPTEGCHPLTVQLENTSAGASGYEWFYGNGTGSTNANQFHDIVLNNTSSAPVDYEIQLVGTSSVGCSKKTTKYVKVFPEVIAAAAPINPSCTPLRVVFNNESVNSSSFKWDFDDGNTSFDKHPSHLFLNNGSVDRIFNVELIAQSVYGCTDTTIVPVEVFFRPNAGFDLSDDVGCHVFELDITNTTTGGVSFDWDFGDGATSTSSSAIVSHDYNNNSDSPIDRTITLITESSNGCADTLMKTVKVLPKVVADFKLPDPSCTPYEVDMFNRSLGATQYRWTFPTETSNLENPSVTLINSTTTDQYMSVSLVAISGFGCEDSINKDVLVYPRPEASFDVDSLRQMYPHAEVKVTNTTPTGNWSYAWDFGDGFQSFTRNPNPYRYTAYGNYTINLVVTGQYCTDTASQIIIIDPAVPIAEFDYNPGEGCVPLTVNFFNKSLYGVNFRWNFGDGNHSQQENPIHTYTLPGTYTVSLEAIGPDDSDLIIKPQIIKVHEYAVAFFSLNPQYPEEVYKDREPVDFFNFSQNAGRYTWDFGDGTFDDRETPPPHYYNSVGTFDVTLIANNQYNCPDTFEIQTAVNVVAGGRLQMPNAFTPNPNGPSGGSTDGVILSNDVFFPFFDEVEKFHMQIFNRWGELIFETNDIDIGWDGYFNGVICPQDVYVYKVAVVYPGGETDVLVGDVTLLK